VTVQDKAESLEEKCQNLKEADSSEKQAAKKNVATAQEALTKAWLRRACVISMIVIVLAALAVVLWATVFTKGHCVPVETNPKICSRPWTPARVGLVWATCITAGALILLGLIFPGLDRGSLVGYIVGKDGRLSTSKMQIALWTTVIAFTFFFFTIQLIRTSHPQELNASFTHFGSEYLLLLGGPFAAAVLAKATTTSKAADGSVQQVAPDHPTAADLVTDHDGQPAISDAQFFLFNLVAIGYFAVALARAPSVLPSIPSTLVALTSVSALTYLGVKVATSNPPTISNVLITNSPSDGFLYAGQTIKVVGGGFMTPAAGNVENLETAAVLFDHVEVKPHEGFTDTAIEAVVPRGLGGTANGNVSISVRSAADVVTTPFTGLMARGLKITSATRDNTTVTVTGYGILMPSDPPSALGDSPVITAADPATPAILPMAGDPEPITHGLKFDLATAPAGPVKVTVSLDGLSDTATTST
jgi:IPT/TIG domain